VVELLVNCCLRVLCQDDDGPQFSWRRMRRRNFFLLNRWFSYTSSPHCLDKMIRNELRQPWNETRSSDAIRSGDSRYMSGYSGTEVWSIRGYVQSIRTWIIQTLGSEI
jgi:hypothetical protein